MAHARGKRRGESRDRVRPPDQCSSAKKTSSMGSYNVYIQRQSTVAPAGAHLP